MSWHPSLPLCRSPSVSPPEPLSFVKKLDEQLTVEEKFLKGRKYDLATDRKKAREYYEKALAQDDGYSPALRGAGGA